MLPAELQQAFDELRSKIDANHAEQTRVRNEQTAAVNSLQTLVVGHYQDVHTLLRLYERKIYRIEVHLKIPHEIEPEPPPRALPDPP